MLAAAMFAVAGRDTLSGGIVGLSISYALQVSQKSALGKIKLVCLYMSVCFCGHLFYVSVRSFAEKYDGSIRIKFWALGNVLVFVDEQDPLNLRTIWYIVCTQSIDYLLFVVRRFIP